MNNETPPNILENAKRLRELFFGTKGYWTTLSDSNKKTIWDYLNSLIKLSDLIK